MKGGNSFVLLVGRASLQQYDVHIPEIISALPIHVVYIHTHRRSILISKNTLTSIVAFG